MKTSSSVRQLLAVSACAVGLTVCDLRLGELAHGIRRPHRWISETGADNAAQHVASTAIWCGCAWLALGLSLSLLVGVPGGCGRLFGRIGVAVLPAAVGRLLGVGLGVTLVLTPTVDSAASAAPTAEAADVSRHVAPLPSPEAPWHRVTTTEAAPALPHSHADPVDRVVEHRVLAGDSLWGIVEHHRPEASGAQVARLTRALYAANRDVIGPDANQLRPGQLLRLPALVDHRLDR